MLMSLGRETSTSSCLSFYTFFKGGRSPDPGRIDHYGTLHYGHQLSHPFSYTPLLWSRGSCSYRAPLSLVVRSHWSYTKVMYSHLKLECQDLWKRNLGAHCHSYQHWLRVWERSRPGLHCRRGEFHYHSSIAAGRIPGVPQPRIVIFAVI